MITTATHNELIDAVDLAKEFHVLTGLDGEFDGELWSNQWAEIIKTEQGCIFKREEGDSLKEAIGVIFYQDGFTFEKGACIRFWYVRGDNKSLATGLLMSHLQERLKADGVKLITISVRLGSNYEGVFKGLAKRGFTPIETLMKKRI